jgi:hypothetical protein
VQVKIAQQGEGHGLLGLGVEEDLVEEAHGGGHAARRARRADRVDERGLRAPPPESSTSRTGSATKRAYASATLCAVSATAVATRSASVASGRAARVMATSRATYAA